MPNHRTVPRFSISSLGDYYYYVTTNMQGDVLGIYNAAGELKVAYEYDAWGNVLSVKDANDKVITSPNHIGNVNPIRYRGYYYDTDTGLYYLQSRYYNPEIGRFLNCDNVSDSNAGIIGYNLFIYCANNPINSSDPTGHWSMPNWLKVTIGVVTTVAAVALTVATGGAAAPVLIGVAASVVTSAAVGYATGGKQGAIDGLCDGLMWGGIGALGGSAVRAVKVAKAAKEGIVIGKCGNFEKIAKNIGCDYYKGLKSYKVIEKISKPLADKLGWAHNKAFVKGVMNLGGEIFDIGGDLTGSYAKERLLTNGYEHITRVGGIF